MEMFSSSKSFYSQFIEGLRNSWTVVAPIVSADGNCRLQTLSDGADSPCGQLPLYPLKKILLPASELLWTCQEGVYSIPSHSAGIALIDIAPCDLYALAYLDDLYADDPYYQERRQRLLVIGAECSPALHCQCPPHTGPPPFDLFIASGCVWSGSALGSKVIQSFATEVVWKGEESLPEKYWGGRIPPLSPDLPLRFLQSVNAPLWGEVAGHCLSCGACSVVCPTCACYDVVDDSALSGETKRHRVWDNCFFRDHALVAGGHNFRADRTARLRFRFEHKFLGFGGQRGVSSCVGCGRCQQVCPVGINLTDIIEKLPALEEQ